MSEVAKTILFIMQRAPYGSSATREALDAALASAAFEQTVQLLFCGDGVWHLITDQRPHLINAKDTSKMLQALEYYDISDVYADKSSLADRQLDSNALAIPAKPVDDDSIRQLVKKADCVIAL